ncbi:adenosylcobinamide-GDP ribazoletransferase [Niallia sp.]|uniref:adenosylcobinamide-GDP ribazoletransferase n=1 Tax=Niallia sp. TaxID=2837523 RepID=UPI00289D391B|nr:adenosylcobinamide-GDP ribazoletransferase [Niallia sp.]
MKKWFIGFLLNIQFFTAIPVRKTLPMEGEFLQKSIKTFPLLGLFQGFIYMGLFFMLKEHTPFTNLAVAFFVWLGMILLTGGLHLDGWMDASDAYFSYQDAKKRLEIMKDPHVGAFRLLSVILLLSTKLLFIYEIVIRMQDFTYLFVMLLPFFSKALMGWILLFVQEAKKDGLGAYFKKSVQGQRTLFYSGYFVLVFLFFLFLFPQWMPLFFLFLSVSIGCYFLLSRFMKRAFGGLTGDLLGASVEGTELVLWATLWLLHYFVMG